MSSDRTCETVDYDKLIEALEKCADDEPLYVMRRNPGGNYYWTKAVGPQIRAAELLIALRLARHVGVYLKHKEGEHDGG